MTTKNRTQIARPTQPATETLACFRLDEPSVPIAGTPAPLPCPFCDGTDSARIVVEYPDGGGYRAHAECIKCGAETCGVSTEDGTGFTRCHEVVYEAARLWNVRRSHGRIAVTLETG